MEGRVGQSRVAVWRGADCLLTALLLLVASCSTAQVAPEPDVVSISRNQPGDYLPELVAVAAGDFIKGSDWQEREFAYRLDEAAYGHRLTREQQWYAQEPPRQQASTPSYHITRTPITNRQYAAFIQQSGHEAPGVDRETWRSYGLIHPFERTRRFAWRGNHPPPGREQHPVVLVSYDDAIAYARWLSRETGHRWRLPGLDEWERAARGDHGGRFPWGDDFDPDRLNSHDAGPFDTESVGRYPLGASPHGSLDAVGQVFEWIDTNPAHARAWVKGGSWDDSGCGVCRPAARHSRPKSIRHILIGFRLVREVRTID